MEAVFLKLLNMSVATGWLILAVLILRLFMKRLPRWLSCALWAIVAVRLICPFHIESPFSLIPSPQILKPYEVQYAEKPAISSGIPALNSMVNPVFGDAFAPAPGASVNPLYVWMFMAGMVWLLGFTLLLGYALVSFLRIRRKVQEAVPLRDNIWICDHVDSPFILGIFRPRIYLSSSIRKEEIGYVLAHEKAHLQRRDHWWKPLGYLLLSVYWFHPLVWAAYVLFCQDIELACDEKVIKDMNLEGKKAYSHALVSCSINKKMITVCPLAFGEGNVKGRVKRVLNYKKPTFWMIAAAGIVCMAAAVCFLTDPSEKSMNKNIIDENAMDKDIVDKNTIDQDIVDENILDKDIVDENILDKDIVDENAIDKHVVHVNIDRNQNLPEYLSGDGRLIWYLDRWYRLEDLSDETIKWLHWFNSMPPEEQQKINFVPWEMQKSIRRNAIDIPAAVETNAENKNGKTDDSNADDHTKYEAFNEADLPSTESALTKAIYAAIMEQNQSVYLDDYDFACCDFVMLEKVSSTPLTGNTAHTVICYGWALYQQYNISENGIESRGGGHTPVALTFTLDHNGYTLTEYWRPRDGGDFVIDIQSKFPEHIAEDGMNSQKFIIQQLQSCYHQAIQYSGLDYKAVIDRLLNTLCSDVDSSFDPQNNYDRRNTEFRELIYYGEYTLRCFFDRFIQGEENGLEGRIMALICEELLHTRGKLPVNAADADTGQLWYYTLLAYDGVLSLQEQPASE